MDGIYIRIATFGGIPRVEFTGILLMHAKGSEDLRKVAGTKSQDC